MNRTWPGHLTLTLRSGEAPATVPCHVDRLAGASRPAGRLDGGPVDRTLSRWGGGARITAVYHARRSLGRLGEQHAGYDDLEEGLGMSRTYAVELAEPEGTADVLAALRELAMVETAAVQLLSAAPMATAMAAPPAEKIDLASAREPHERIHAAQALALEPGDERITTAVVDTGFTIGHPELQRKCLAGYDTVNLGMGRLNGDVKLLGDSRGHDYNPKDEVGHGSGVAGILGAQGWFLPKGVAGLSLLLPVRALAAAVGPASPRRVGVGALADISAGLKVAVDLGAQVINMSFGTPESSTDPAAPKPHARVVRYAAELGCVLIAAAGNSGKKERFYPAALPEVIAVGSCDAAGRRSSFSTWGEHVALCAPGERIITAAMTGYQRSSGTSFAAPFAAGVAALLVSRARRSGRRLDGAAVRRLLTASAAPLGAGFSPETGHGLLDALAALRRLDAELGRPA